MSKPFKKRRRYSEDLVGWAGTVIMVVAMFVLDKPSEPHKWHPAIVWTGLAFTTIALFGRTLWSSWRFWVLSTIFLMLHVYAMWWLFDQLLPHGHVWGTLFVVPIAFVEGILLVGVIAWIDHKLREGNHHRLKT
jgi:hypothetical protein